MIFLELTHVNLTKRFRSIISNLFQLFKSSSSVIKVASSRMNFVEFIIDTSPLGIIVKTLLFFVLAKEFFSIVIFGCKRGETIDEVGKEKLSSEIEKLSIAASVQPVTTLMLATTLQNEALTLDFQEVVWDENA